MSPDDLAGWERFYLWFRLGYVATALIVVAALWRRARPEAALALVIALSVAAWAAYALPIGRTYALDEHLDVGFAVGIAACIAAGNSVWDHTQVGFANLEPLWGGAVAALALFRPERVASVFRWFPLVAIVASALGLFFGLRESDSDEDRWERVLIVLAVLGLGSMSLTALFDWGRTPVPPLWIANFLLKPTHAAAWGLVGISVGLWSRRASALRVGLTLGALAWVYLLDWAYLLVGLGVAALCFPTPERRWRTLARAVFVSLLLAAPYFANLFRDYNPATPSPTSLQIWFDDMGRRLASPWWVTLDTGVLFPLAALGTAVLWRRDTRRDRVMLSVVAGSWIAWLAYELGATIGLSPEPDEHHYYLRMVMGLAAGTALAAGARWIEARRRLRPGQGHLLVIAACVPLTFPALWNPPRMDRYFRVSAPPLRPRVLDYTRWVRENTPGDAIFVAGPSAAIWIPALAGRRVLLASDSRPPKDYDARKAAERVLLTSRDPDEIRAAARRFGVSYVAIDPEMASEYGADAVEGIGKLPAYEALYLDSAVRIVRIR